MNLRKLSTGLTSVGGLISAGFVLSNFIYRVEPGERALIFNKFGNKGVSKNVIKEGFHFYIPFV